MLGAERRLGRAWARAAAGVTLAAAVAGLAAGNASAQAVTWPSGAYAGAGGGTYNGVGDAAFGSWRDLPVTVATDYIGEDNWSEIEDPTWAIQQWQTHPTVTPDFSLALWPSSGGDFADAAAGAYNGYFATLAKNLVASGLGGIAIRIGWEFNGTWYRWSVTTAAQAAQYAQAWRQIVTAMRAVPGAHFTFVWCPDGQAGGIDPSLAYPGDAYVDVIGLDLYDWNENGSTTPASRWNALVNAGYGLGWQASFAAAHNKPIGFPEWGLVDDGGNSAAGGNDDPLFIQNMFNWFSTHNVAFEDYFNADASVSGEYFGIDTGNGDFPKSAALYQNLWSGGKIGPAGSSAGAAAPESGLLNSLMGLL